MDAQLRPDRAPAWLKPLVDAIDDDDRRADGVAAEFGGAEEIGDEQPEGEVQPGIDHEGQENGHDAIAKGPAGSAPAAHDCADSA